MPPLSHAEPAARPRPAKHDSPEAAEVDHRQQLIDYADALDSVTRRMREFLVNFSDDRVRLNLITEELRQNVIELTMLPMGSVFDAFPRAVRDLARTFEKEIELTIHGRETELDKKIIEQIAEPLIHMIRNAVDHGIEMPAERVRMGKAAAGQLVLSAISSNRISSPQRRRCGIDPPLRAAAIRGPGAAFEIDRWSREQVFDSSSVPGSPRARLPPSTGRGWHDVVNSLWRSGGTVRVRRSDQGTTVMLNLPLSLALLRVVLMEAGDELFALPTAAIRRIVQVSTGEVGHLQQDSLVELDGENIPLTSLSTMLQVPRGPVPARQTVLVAESSDGRFGVIVDAVHEEPELVFKELRGPLRNQKPFTGAALVGNGDIVPILDVNSLFYLASRSPAGDAVPAAVQRAAPRVPRVLVVDDSLVAGELQKNILVAAGYESEIAGDGVEALECLRGKEWDLVIADAYAAHEGWS